MKFIIAVTVTIVSCVVDLMLAAFMMIWLDAANHFDERVPAFGYWT